jgi:glycosyltransferase involved in cell wall biosynthesis
MLILIVSRGYTAKESPLLGIFEMDQAKALQSFGHKVIIASIDLRSIRRIRRLGFTHLFYDGIEIYSFSFPLGRVNKKLLLYIGQIGIVKIYNLIVKKNGKPDILHSHFTVMGAIAAIIKKKYNIPFIFTEHSSAINCKEIKPKDVFFAQNTYPYADKVLSVSSSLAYYIKYHFNVDSTIVHNIIDLDCFSVAHNDLNNEFVFLSVGNLIYIKGFDILIEAFAKANFETSVKLLIIGSGKEKYFLEKSIKQYDLQENIKLLGFKNRQEIAFYLQNCHAFALASRSETFGVVYIEAMATGLPVIATKCGGPEDFVNEQNGILVNVDDVDDLSCALKNMYTNIHKYNANIIRNEVVRKFSSETVAKQLTEIYDLILKK